ncbi:MULTISPECIES: hypothetical protein [unclassified Sphingobium]|uniref:hypothetical protein n=1 Tax=unclassified Sphingobium TaxID=2611147 RepID=UPI000D4CB143|nr:MULTISPECIES: hypothetical protein [unclassified Sphingobium]MBG6116378.1 hypothetical protein [Sphingobium sp. JAI105]PSO09882.1 hypothetical protein C7E20_20040 [Sphingobium sp. AEW4]
MLDMEVCWPALGGTAPTLLTGIDAGSGIVRIVAGGFWEPGSSAAFFEAQSLINAEARQRYGRLRVVFDLSTAIAQTPQTIERLQTANRDLYSIAPVGLALTHKWSRA